MLELPSPEAQEWAITRLAQLVRVRGADTFLAAHLLLPTPTYFPDPWARDAPGVYRLARRLLGYAGLGDLEVRVDLVGVARSMEFEGTSETNGVAAIFRGIDGGVAEFVVDRNTLQDPTGVVGTMAHEVAHVFRCFHGLEVDDHDEEERLTDLTCVYLGYGSSPRTRAIDTAPQDG